MPDSTTTVDERGGTGQPLRAVQATLDRFVGWLADRNSFALMGGFFVLGFLADRVPRLEPFDWVFFLVGGLLPIVLATVSTESDGFRPDVSNRERVRFVLSQLGFAFTPWGLLTQALQLGGTLAAYVRYLGRLPNRDRHVPATEPRVPFEGEWTTVNGGVTKSTSHSWGIVAQRYAYDFVVTDEDGDTHEGDGDELTDYHAFGERVLAPADGTVVTTLDSLRDHPHPGSGWVEWRTWRITGNHVVIEHDDGEYSLLAHLRQGSVAVEPGDEVERGDVVGECGNSGLSTEPHLHFQLQDSPNFWIAAGLVPRFVGTAVDRDDDRRVDHEVYGAAPDPEDGAHLWAGDRVAAET